jgi:4-amino-4-deoxy-L-arabinose transferase-like glycosyltransferase
MRARIEVVEVPDNRGYGPATRRGRLPRSTVTVLLAIMCVGVLLRCASALLQGDQVEALPGITDQLSYDTLARSVLTGHGFTFPEAWWPATRPGAPTAHWSFLYTVYLTAVYALVGVHPLAARLIQAVIAGVLYPWFAWRLGRRLFGPSVGLAAAVLIAIYAYFVYYGGALMTETFYILGILWALDLVTELASTHGDQQLERRSKLIAVRPWLLLGLALGFSVLLRQLLLLFVPVVFAWLLWAMVGSAPHGSARLRLRSALRGILVASVVIVVLIAPWTIRNYRAFGRFVLLNTNTGYAFFWANHPIYGTNFVSILPAGEYAALIPSDLRPLDEAALESALMQRGVQFVLDDPGRYVLLSISRVKDYFEFWPAPNSNPISNIARVLSFGVFLPLMVYGLASVFARRRELLMPGQERALALICLFGLSYTLIHLLSWALVRYRLPIDAVFMPVAALAVVDLLAGGRALWRGSSLPLKPRGVELTVAKSANSTPTGKAS